MSGETNSRKPRAVLVAVRRGAVATFVAMLLFATTALTGGLGGLGLGGSAGGFRASAATLGEYGSRLSFTLTGIDPVVTTSASANLVSVAGQYTNTGPDPIADLEYRFQRGDRLTTAAAVQGEAATPTQPVAVINPTFRPLPGTLAAGRSANFSVGVPVTGDATESLGITEPGVYPLMININGTVQTSDGDVQARVGEVHLLLTVASVPGSVTAAPSSSAPAPVGILWPLVDSPHLELNGVFRNDDLAAEIEPGGRLANAVDMLAASTADPNLVTLAIDPMLLDELSRMSQGYWVAASPHTPQPGLRPSTTTATPTTTPTSPSTASSTTGPTTSVSPGESGASAGESGAGGASGASGASGAGETSAMTESSGSSGSPGDSGSVATASDGGKEGEPPPAGAAGAIGDDTTSGQSGTPGSKSAADSSTPTAPTGPTAPTTEQSPPQQPPQTSQSTPPLPPQPQPADTVAGTGQAAAAAFLDQLRGLAATHAVLVLPYGDPDIVPLVRAGMSEEVATAVYRGRAIAASVLGQGLDTPSSPSNLITDVAAPPGGTLTGQAWKLLQSLGYTSAILDPSGVTASGKSGAATGLVTVSVEGDEVPAVVSGGGHATAFAQVLQSGAPADWASTVNTLAAVTMVEGAAATGPMVIVPPTTFSPRGSGFLALATALDDLALVGMVLPMPVTAIARGGEPGSTDGSAQALTAAPQTAVVLHYSARALAAELPAWYLSRLQKIQQHLDVLGQTLSSTPTGPDPAEILDPLADALLSATSVAWRGHPDPDALVLHTVDATIGWLYHGVTITRDTGSYTLASSTAPLLLTVSNTLPYQVTMTLRIIGGEQAGLAAQDPGRIVIGPGPRSTPVKVHSVVSRSGTFTVYAQLQGAEGSQWGQAVPLTIDSRAYGALTVVLMSVAGGVLLLMVIWRLVQRWRGHGGEGGSDESDGDDEDEDDSENDDENRDAGPDSDDMTSAPRAANYVTPESVLPESDSSEGVSARNVETVDETGRTSSGGDVVRASGGPDLSETSPKGATS